MTIQITNYKSTDYPVIQSLLKKTELFDEVWDSQENINSMIENDPNSILTAIDQKKVVGIIMSVPYGNKVTNLFRLAIYEQYQNQGVGSQLIAQAELNAKSRGVDEIGLYVDQNNKKLQHFYQKKGYQNTNKPWIYMFKKVK